jgi:orotidine-5'-phosphate decarboxylase
VTQPPAARTLPGRERLIVALDVPTADEALRAVEKLHNVSFFKVGLQLFVAGEMPRLLQSLRGKQVFMDLKVPGDIANTLAAVIDLCVDHQVTFLTVSESMPRPAIAAMKAARDARESPTPRLLTVPYLSSLDASDLGGIAGEGGITRHTDVEGYIVRRADAALRAGCEGIIVSGRAIRACRAAFAHPTIIVSPGIRPKGASTDDHKRQATPADAVRWGADYLVVGRPILTDPDPRGAADRIIDEIDAAIAEAGGR